MLLGFALFVMGVVFGAMGVGALGAADRLELLNLVLGHFAGLRHGPSAGGSLPGAFVDLAGRYLSLIGLFWLLGLSVVGSLYGLAYLFYRGYAAGFAAGFLHAQLGWKGVLYAAAALLPHNLVAVLAIVLAAAGALDFALALVQGRGRRSRSDFYRELGDYTRWMAGAALLAVVAALVEAVVTPLLMRMAAGI